MKWENLTNHGADIHTTINYTLNTVSKTHLNNIFLKVTTECYSSHFPPSAGLDIST